MVMVFTLDLVVMVCQALKWALKEKYIGKSVTLVLMAPALMEKNGNIPTVVLLYGQTLMAATLRCLLMEIATRTSLHLTNMET